MKTLWKLLDSVPILTLVCGMGLCTLDAQDPGAAREEPISGKSLVDCFRGIAIEPSSEAAIRTLKEVHADFTYFPAKGNSGYAQYYTKVGTPDPSLKTDPLKESLRLAHKAGIKVLVTYAVGVDTLAARMRPDWAFRRSDGEPISAAC